MKMHSVKYAVPIFCLILILILPPSGIADYPDGIYAVSHIINGDTFVLADGTRVRLLGIDAPDAGEYCVEQATQRLASLISGRNVTLEKDVSERDASNNLLRYVHVGQTFVNLALVEEGYAWAMTKSPDIRYNALLTNAEESARNTHRGCLWNVFISYDDTDGFVEVRCFIHSLTMNSFEAFSALTIQSEEGIR